MSIFVQIEICAKKLALANVNYTISDKNLDLENILVHVIWSSNCWIRSSGEEDAEEEVRSQKQEVEEEKFCWVWRAKLTILVALRKIFLLADLLIAAEMRILYT